MLGLRAVLGLLGVLRLHGVLGLCGVLGSCHGNGFQDQIAVTHRFQVSQQQSLEAYSSVATTCSSSTRVLDNSQICTWDLEAQATGGSSYRRPVLQVVLCSCGWQIAMYRAGRQLRYFKSLNTIQSRASWLRLEFRRKPPGTCNGTL